MSSKSQGPDPARAGRMELPAFLAARLAALPARKRLLIAYSGGLDSSVLLHALRELTPEAPLFALHVHHGLHAQADAVAAFCAARARRLGVPFERIDVEVKPRGRGVEAAARDVRYAALRARMRPGDLLLTAQHADDQAETLLLQLLRGAGPRGLAAMPELRRLGPGWLARPLLGLRREHLRAWAEARGVEWNQDPTNADLSLDRNYLRQRVMPLLEERWPGAATTLSRSARLCAQQQQALEGLLARQPAHAGRGETLACRALRELDEPERQALLRDWLRRRGAPMPPERRLRAALAMLLDARADRQPAARLDAGHELRRYRDRIHLLPTRAPGAPPKRAIPWCDEAPLALPDGALLDIVTANGPGIDPACWRRARREVRYRRGGETLVPAGREHRLSLKEIFQWRGVPPWRRVWTPLLYLDGELAAVGDLCVARAFAHESGPAITLAHHQPGEEG